MTATLGHWTAGRIRRLSQDHNGTSGHIRRRQAGPAPQGRGTARHRLLWTGAVICYPARPPSSVVTHSASSVVATQTLTLRQETAPASMLPSEAVTSDQDLPPSAVPSSASFW
jgi:hypothetical protein